jgi:diacylglycerol kinase family enzyme
VALNSAAAEPARRGTAANAPLFVVLNCASGANDAAAVQRCIEQGCAAAGRELHLFVIDGADQLDALAQQAVQSARAAGGVVVAAGGDGTLNTVAQAVLGSGCPFGVLPQGTFNYFGRAHGIPGDTEQALQIVLTETARPVQVGQVNERLFLVNASIGLYPRVLEDREGWKQRLRRARWVALIAALATLLRGYRSLHLQIELNGKVHTVHTPTLFVGNNPLQMEQLGLPLAESIDGGALAAVLPRPMSRLTMLWLMLRGAFGELGHADQVLHFPFSRVTVGSAARFAARRIKVATDGEIAWMELPLKFAVAADALALIHPAGPAPERARS